MNDDIHWRYTALEPRFLIFDARVLCTCILALLHLRLWTIGLVFASFMFFWVIERKGYSMPVFLRTITLKIGAMGATKVLIGGMDRTGWRLDHF